VVSSACSVAGRRRRAGLPGAEADHQFSEPGELPTAVVAQRLVGGRRGAKGVVLEGEADRLDGEKVRQLVFGVAGVLPNQTSLGVADALADIRQGQAANAAPDLADDPVYGGRPACVEHARPWPEGLDIVAAIACSGGRRIAFEARRPRRERRWPPQGGCRKNDGAEGHVEPALSGEADLAEVARTGAG